jgi:hypothetical protein
MSGETIEKAPVSRTFLRVDLDETNVFPKYPAIECGKITISD